MSWILIWLYSHSRIFTYLATRAGNKPSQSFTQRSTSTGSQFHIYLLCFYASLALCLNKFLNISFLTRRRPKVRASFMILKLCEGSFTPLPVPPCPRRTTPWLRRLIRCSQQWTEIVTLCQAVHATSHGGRLRDAVLIRRMLH